MAENKNKETVKKAECGVKEKTVKLRLPRSKAEKNIRKVFRDGQPVEV